MIMENELNVDTLVEGLIKRNNLTSLMDEESKLFKQIQNLNSQFQTLLYENYNKLISPAQIIGQMTNKFDHMELDINSLSDNMEEIIKKSDHLSSNLWDKFNDLSKLSTTYLQLKRLEFYIDLNDLVVSTGQNLSKIMMVSIEEEDWLADQKPSHVRPVLIKIIEEMLAISNRLSEYCQDSQQIELTGQYYFHRGQLRVNNSNNIPDKNIKKLFSDRIETFEPVVTFRRRTILFAVIKILLKAMIETIRLQTFNMNGVHQLEIDLKYLQHELTGLVPGEDKIFVLLDETIDSAEIRCEGYYDVDDIID